MKTLILAAVLSLAATNAFATCKSDSADKKLAGAAATDSFMKKCETDATAKLRRTRGKARRRGKTSRGSAVADAGWLN